MRISVVTPSYNQATFLEENLDSISGSDDDTYELEHIVVDGGSEDGTVEVLRRRDQQLSWWTSETDAGQYDAINKGFQRADGDVLAWLNADDVYFPWTLRTVAEVFSQLPQVEWITSMHPVTLRPDGTPVACGFRPGFSQDGFLRGENMWGGSAFQTGYIQQESTFWRRELWQRAGGLVDHSLDMAGDFELWARFFEHADLYALRLPLAGFRVHGAQKTQDMDRYVRECQKVLAHYGGRRPGWFMGRLRKLIAWPAQRRLRLREPVPRISWDDGSNRWIIERV